MKARSTLLPALLLACVVLLLHLQALREHLYFHHPWFHIGIHFLTGLVLALTISFVSLRLRPHSHSIRSLSVTVLPIVLLIALGWEMFEYTNGLIYATGTLYALDTLRDIVMGLIGGFVGILYVRSVVSTQ